MDNPFNESIENEKEKDSFLKQNQILFKKYHPIKPIGKGTFSTVYASINIITKAFVAIKIEKRGKDNIELLESEAFLLYSLRGFGIPEVLSYGRTKTHNILVLPLLGKSLLDIFILRNSVININDICGVAIQILDRIEWVHSNNIVYRDIKPENFLFGKKDNDVLYLIDFGLCRKYKSSTTGEHIKPKNLGKFTGTSRYASVYAMAGYEQSRRDDIESIGYMIIFFMKKRLPWQGIKGRTYKECYHKLFLMKKYMKIEELCKGLPKEIIEYMNYAKEMKFEQEPNYKYLKDLFRTILKKNNIIFDKYIYSWCRKDVLNNKDYIAKKYSNQQIERKSSPYNRPYKKIEENIEYKKKTIPSSGVKQIEINDKNKNITLNSYENSIKKIIEINSELSNTMKVMVNKNINSINSGFMEPTRIKMSRMNSDKNIYKDNLISFKGNNDMKKHYSPDDKKHIYLSLKEDNNNKNNNSLVKKSNIQKNGNKNRIIRITPITNTKYINDNNNNIINNTGNHFNKINQINKAKIYVNNPNINTKNNNIINNNNNIIYNTYNTFNTYNSFNNTIDKSSNNNINKIYQRRPEEINNYQNYERIKKQIFEINNDKINKINKIQNVNINNVNINNVNINNRNNMIKIYTPLVEKNAKSLNNIINRNNINKNPIKNGSINIRLNSNNSEKNIKSGQKIVNNKFNGKKKTIGLDDYFSIPLFGYTEKDNKIINNETHTPKNIKKIFIRNLNEHNNTNMNNKNNSNYKNISNKKKEGNSLNIKFLRNIENSMSNSNKFYNNYNSIQINGNNNLNELFNLKRNVNNNLNNNTIKNNTLNRENMKIIKVKMRDSANSRDKNSIANNIFSNIKIIANNKKNNLYREINCSNNSLNRSNNSSLKNKIKNNKLSKQYQNKNKKPINSIRINKNNIFQNNSFRNLISLQNNKNNECYHKGNNDTNKMKTKLIKMEPKMLSNHSMKIMNNSSTINKTNSTIPNNNNIIKDHNYYINRFKTEEISIGSKVNRINKYKIIRNKEIQ